jgi:hypothetical protein
LLGWCVFGLPGDGIIVEGRVRLDDEGGAKAWPIRGKLVVNFIFIDFGAFGDSGKKVGEMWGVTFDEWLEGFFLPPGAMWVGDVLGAELNGFLPGKSELPAGFGGISGDAEEGDIAFGKFALGSGGMGLGQGR